jgi:actin-like ATPase involved in cell morphogenesis
MVGGGALLSGLIERIEERTNLPVEIAVTTQGLNNASLYAASIGLAQTRYLARRTKKLSVKSLKNFKETFVNTVREVCQEYF